MNKWQQQVYDMLRAASRNNLPCTIPADVTHIPANMMLEADKQKWISVKDRLPEPKMDVIIADNQRTDIGAYYPNQPQKWESYSWFNPKPTHWMPLPEPPKEDGHACDSF